MTKRKTTTYAQESKESSAKLAVDSEQPIAVLSQIDKVFAKICSK